MNLKKVILAIVLLLALSACATTNNQGKQEATNCNQIASQSSFSTEKGDSDCENIELVEQDKSENKSDHIILRILGFAAGFAFGSFLFSGL